ncbi:hypothetical protein EDD27_3693 [Nonomuraea polychroma]|uniref:Uncharacterized protein n=1 Tax=Nonomuraea polychroma TaxID=46176 RepID=A0A438M677_9ACTN|nr:hypothetical protein EDD27_3693 [Nonomuraea polychroma]
MGEPREDLGTIGAAAGADPARITRTSSFTYTGANVEFVDEGEEAGRSWSCGCRPARLVNPLVESGRTTFNLANVANVIAADRGDGSSSSKAVVSACTPHGQPGHQDENAGEP